MRRRTTERSLQQAETPEAACAHRDQDALCRRERKSAWPGAGLTRRLLLSGRRDALLRRAPLRTRTCDFHRIRLKQDLEGLRT